MLLHPPCESHYSKNSFFLELGSGGASQWNSRGAAEDGNGWEAMLVGVPWCYAERV